MNRFFRRWIKFNWSKIAIFGLDGLTLSAGILIFLNWTFLKRAVTYPDRPITAVDWYEPLE